VGYWTNPVVSVERLDRPVRVVSQAVSEKNMEVEVVGEVVMVGYCRSTCYSQTRWMTSPAPALCPIQQRRLISREVPKTPEESPGSA